ncbi:MAG TPA: flagellar hook capping protein [Actinobacteria bacterium]|nr:flagellar hook capping protein [Actinomycetota bacterium]
MPIDPVGTPANPTTSAETALGRLGSDAFLKLLVAQLRYQNPMAPSDGAAMLQQTAQFTTVETLKAISESSQRLMGLQQVTLAMSVVGKEVDAISPGGGSVTGVVDRIRFTADGPMLSIGGVEVPLDNVLEVRSVAPAP